MWKSCTRYEQLCYVKQVIFARPGAGLVPPELGEPRIACDLCFARDRDRPSGVMQDFTT